MLAVTLLFVVTKFCVATGALTTIVPSQGTCRHGWINFHDSCYLFSHTVLSWPEAEEACKIIHSDLATVQTQEEVRFLKSYLNGIHAANYPAFGYWINGNDLEVNKEWQWSSIQKPMNYTDWGPGEPSNHANEDCLLLWGAFHFKMGDYYCYVRRNYICQQKTPVVPNANLLDGWISFG
ncbi:perlucin-like [Mizuhopecten yessoensis]|uniref:Perlucin-like protein n=1 Tax=Mizuhopecten yessoensis TaxID=6573 RepID=A0A210R4X0_MIZYE|nr:perlucin-like [Mizuhopecten yessoensis]OWF56072.1 Perlucin-like protein [Mizuhopecten yessoensis]